MEWLHVLERVIENGSNESDISVCRLSSFALDVPSPIHTVLAQPEEMKMRDVELKNNFARI